MTRLGEGRKAEFDLIAGRTSWLEPDFEAGVAVLHGGRVRCALTNLNSLLPDPRLDRQHDIELGAARTTCGELAIVSNHD
jgi:hypothetical protein